VDVDGQPISAASFSLSSSTGQLFASDALPLDPNFASQADLVSLVLTHGDATQGFSPPAPVVEIFTPVPEASTYALLLAGLASVFAFRRARRS